MFFITFLAFQPFLKIFFSFFNFYFIVSSFYFPLFPLYFLNFPIFLFLNQFFLLFLLFFLFKLNSLTIFFCCHKATNKFNHFNLTVFLFKHNLIWLILLSLLQLFNLISSWKSVQSRNISGSFSDCRPSTLHWQLQEASSAPRRSFRIIAALFTPEAGIQKRWNVSGGLRLLVLNPRD